MNKPAFIILLFAALPAVFGQDVPPCQFVDTTAGRLTANHCGLETATHRDPEIDFSIDVRVTGKTETSDLSPAVFVDRRGGVHPIVITRRTVRFWFVELKFFPGESGSGVFDKNGRCCGIVLGNTKLKKWVGRILRLSHAADRSPVFKLDKTGR